MKRREIMAAALSLAVSGAALAQAAGEAPKPTAEHKKLGYFVGKWTTEGDMKPNPFGPGGKVTATDNCEWFEGGFSVVCKSEGKSPAGPTKGMGIMSYNTEEKAYTYYGLDNSPMSMSSVHGTGRHLDVQRRGQDGRQAGQVALRHQAGHPDQLHVQVGDAG